MNRKASGFTLTELMVALVLGLFVTGVTLNVYLSADKTARLNQQLTVLNEATRSGYSLLAQDIRRAGYSGCGNSVRLVNVAQDAVAGQNWAVWNDGIEGFEQPAPAFNGVTPNEAMDAIRLMFAAGRSYAVLNHDTAATSVQLNTSVGFAAGDLLLLCDETLSSIFVASAVADDTVLHQLGAANCTSGLGFPLLCDGATGTVRQFSTNAVLMRLDSVSWYVADSADGQALSLYRVLNNAEAEEVVYGVEDFQLAFISGPNQIWQDADSVADWADVLAVRVSLVLQSPPGMESELAAASRTLSYSVHLRNRG
ncbi:prepilin-type N-terminal cleavage/methylation domain-containing protein [Rheinheimera sp.]|uniref:prepilin-type N-terminal cleavage/methylation domain-containing protein n=1 Tax=Rheinheimera sp. TaxID=1869214 RepID=UPI00307EB168